MRSGLHRGRLTEADDAQLVVDQLAILGTNLLEVEPELLLDVDCCAVERAQIISVLGLRDLAEVRFHQHGAMLERTLQVRRGAQELNLVGGNFAFPRCAQFDKMLSDVLELIGFRAQGVLARSGDLALSSEPRSRAVRSSGWRARPATDSVRSALP